MMNAVETAPQLVDIGPNSKLDELDLRPQSPEFETVPSSTWLGSAEFAPTK